MNQDYVLYLQQCLRNLGFGSDLSFNATLEQEMIKGNDEFQLQIQESFDEGSVIKATLYFWKASNNPNFVLTKYHATLCYNENPKLNKSHTFLIYRLLGVTFKEAFNLLQGRAVLKTLFTPDQEMYDAWIQLDFSKKIAYHHYSVHQFKAPSEYDLEKILNAYPIRELATSQQKADLIQSLEEGNLHPVTFETEQTVQKIYISANPQSKTINILSQAGPMSPL